MQDPDRKAREAAQGVVTAAYRLTNDFEPADPLGEGGKEKLGFKPRDHHPDADVNSAAERDVAHRSPSQVKTIRVLPLTRVSIGGA